MARSALTQTAVILHAIAITATVGLISGKLQPPPHFLGRISLPPQIQVRLPIPSRSNP